MKNDPDSVIGKVMKDLGVLAAACLTADQWMDEDDLMFGAAQVPGAYCQGCYTIEYSNKYAEAFYRAANPRAILRLFGRIRELETQVANLIRDR